jgi:hypothetical protein
VSTDVSEEHIASVFRVEKISSARNQRESRLCSSLALKMEAICSSETSVDTQRTTQLYIPEDVTLQCSSLTRLMVYILVITSFGNTFVKHSANLD